MNNTRLAEKLLSMKEQVDEEKTEKNREEGKLEEMLKQLKNEFGCKGPKAVQKLIDQKEEEIGKDSKALEKGIRVLEEGYDW